jgi:hypothetical protein
MQGTEEVGGGVTHRAGARGTLGICHEQQTEIERHPGGAGADRVMWDTHTRHAPPRSVAMPSNDAPCASIDGEGAR